MFSSDIHCKENDGFRVVPINPGLIASDSGVREVAITVLEFSMSWVHGYDPEIKSFPLFPYNENPTRALNTNSLKCCLSSTNAIDRRKKFTHAYDGLKSPHASALH